MNRIEVRKPMLTSFDAAVAENRRKLADQFPKLLPMIMDEDLTTLAVNEEYVDSNGITLKNGDTVAVIPPISGG